MSSDFRGANSHHRQFTLWLQRQLAAGSLPTLEWTSLLTDLDGESPEGCYEVHSHTHRPDVTVIVCVCTIGGSRLWEDMVASR